MKYRRPDKTGFDILEVSLSAWQVGRKWGETFDQAMFNGKVYYTSIVFLIKYSLFKY